MSLTPEDIEARRFAVRANGYDQREVEQFLTEVAAAYRSAVRGSDAEARDRGGFPLGSSARPVGPADNGGDDAFGRLGEEISDMLRSARRLADSVRAEAEAESEVVRARAELEANETRSKIDYQLEQAKRIQKGAQANADQILADAELKAQALLQAAEDEARARAQRISAEADREAEEIKRTRQATVDQLHAARADVQEAIERLAGRTPTPVLDLTTTSAVVHPPPEVIADDEPAEPPAAAPTPVAVGEPTADVVTEPAAGEEDPLTRMVRAAVVRAVEASATPAEDAPER